MPRAFSARWRGESPYEHTRTHKCINMHVLHYVAAHKDLPTLFEKTFHSHSFRTTKPTTTSSTHPHTHSAFASSPRVCRFESWHLRVLVERTQTLEGKLDTTSYMHEKIYLRAAEREGGSTGGLRTMHFAPSPSNKGYRVLHSTPELRRTTCFQTRKLI